MDDTPNDPATIVTADSVSKNVTSIFNSFNASKSLSSSSSTTTATFGGDAFLKTDPGLSFASLAQTSGTGENNGATGFTASASKGSSGTFFGLSTKDDFSSFQPKSDLNRTLNGSNSGVHDVSTGGADGTGNDANYDPHYDAIIPLPDEIVVSTGEEEEEKVFGERAKLFRYDATNKEWKERGEIIVLFTR